MNLQLTAPQRASATIALPFSKSITNRALLIQALCGDDWPQVFHPALCHDTAVMVKALAHNTNAPINIEGSGTAMRFLTAYFATRQGLTVTLDGNQRMRQRPIGVLVDALRALGADIRYLGEDGFPPLLITGKTLHGGEVVMDGGVSSQYISAVMMVLPTIGGGTIRLEGDIVSAPYIHMTASVMHDMGASVDNSETYEFKLYTPWKFGLSLGHTVGNYLALGASYEYANYAHLDSRYKTGSYYDYWYGDYYDESESDREMNNHTKETLKGASTLKLGLAYKPDPAIAVRFGYNYVSPMYKLEGYKDGTIASDGSYYSSATDYTNWKGTNRITCGVGYTTGHFNLDVAYQYSATDGEFAPFMNYWDDVTSEDDNVANVVNVSNKRHQLMVTLGYKF